MRRLGMGHLLTLALPGRDACQALLGVLPGALAHTRRRQQEQAAVQSPCSVVVAHQPSTIWCLAEKKIQACARAAEFCTVFGVVRAEVGCAWSEAIADYWAEIPLYQVRREGRRAGGREDPRRRSPPCDGRSVRQGGLDARKAVCCCWCGADVGAAAHGGVAHGACGVERAGAGRRRALRHRPLPVRTSSLFACTGWDGRRAGERTTHLIIRALPQRYDASPPPTSQR